MRKIITYLTETYSGLYLPVLIIILALSSCNPTKYVPKGNTLLDNNQININKGNVKKADLLPYIKQKPNKRIFGARFHLGLYNLSNDKKEKWPHNWLRVIGEEPVKFDSSAAVKTTEQMKSYVASKGYFDGKVKDSIVTENRKTTVIYNIDLQPAYTIRNLYYEIADSNIRRLFYFDSVNCVIDRGKPYDVDVLQAERTRFERLVKDHGFYSFSSDLISFGVDSTIGHRQVNIYYNVRSVTKTDQYNRITSVPLPVYSVKNIYIYPDYVPKAALEGGETYFKGLDTIKYNGYFFITTKEKPDIRFDLIIQSLYLKPGSIYNITNTEQTQSHLLALKVYRLVNIAYNDYEGTADTLSGNMMLDCNIQLTLLTPQSYKVELEGTNSAGYLGGALNLIYQHKNLFHGAELFSLKFNGSYEAIRQQDTNRLGGIVGTKLRSIQEYGVETSMRLPKFILPFVKTEGFIKKYNPSTVFLAAYNYQAMPFYTRTVAAGNFGYDWKAGQFQEHIVNPLQLNLVDVISIDSTFKARIDASSYQAFSYRSVLIFGGNYSFIYNNQKIKNSRDYWFLRINAEAAGNMLGLAEKIAGGVKTTGGDRTPSGALVDSTKTYRILGQPFAQYVRSDLDIRYYYKFNDASSIAYRGFVGIGIPFGNSKEIPFEKQYFSGGANGIRAWQVRSLGPGSYNPNPGHIARAFLNETADIKLEANAEYRFKLFWILEGALFVDAGNIWSYYKDPARLGAEFQFNKFYKDIAIGTGTGFRFDLKFVIARVDIGMKLRDPVLAGDSRWIMFNGPYRREDFAIVLGIGYPF